MGRTIWHCHVAASLDGKIARPDGSVDDWLADEYPAEDFALPPSPGRWTRPSWAGAPTGPSDASAAPTGRARASPRPS